MLTKLSSVVVLGIFAAVFLSATSGGRVLSEVEAQRLYGAQSICSDVTIFQDCDIFEACLTAECDDFGFNACAFKFAREASVPNN